MLQAIAYRAVGIVLLLVGLPAHTRGRKAHFHRRLALLPARRAWLCGCRRPASPQAAIGGWIYLAVFAATLIWSLSEVGLQFWQLLPRVAGPLFFAVLCAALLGWGGKQEESASKRRPVLAWGLCLIGAGLLLAAYAASGPKLADSEPASREDGCR